MTDSPFAIQYSPGFPKLLHDMRCSLALSTYQAGKVIMLSASDETRLIQLTRTFERAMGIAVDGNRLAVACRNEVVVFNNSKQLARHYPKKPEVYDAMFMPRVTYHTGLLDLHDLDFCNDGLYAVNTSFSCVVKISDAYSFDPVWTPEFITKIAAEDRCHLNGMAVDSEGIRFVTAFSSSDKPKGWKDTGFDRGILIDYASKEIVLNNLVMPHSPRIYNGKVYLLQSGAGSLTEYDPESQSSRIIYETTAFLRGMTIMHDVAFVGVSKLREKSKMSSYLQAKDFKSTSGILAIHLPSGKLLAQCAYVNTVDEIYDVRMLPGLVRPNIQNTRTDIYNKGISIPERTFWAKLE